MGGACGAAGSFLNPYGWHLHAHVFSYLRDDQLTSRVAEFQSFNFHDKDATQVALTMALAAAGGVLALQQKKLAHFLLAAVFLWGALRSARVIPLVALLVLPLANGAFTEALRRARDLRFWSKIEAALDYSGRIRVIDQRLSGLVFCGLALLVCLPAISSAASSRPLVFRWRLRKLWIDFQPEARLLTSDSFGGYLIYVFNGTRKVFLDGRSDYYGADFMKQYLVLMSARPGWQEIVRSYGFTHALLSPDSALTAALEQAGWPVLYHDEVAILLQAPTVQGKLPSEFGCYTLANLLSSCGARPTTAVRFHSNSCQAGRQENTRA